MNASQSAGPGVGSSEKDIVLANINQFSAIAGINEA